MSVLLILVAAALICAIASAAGRMPIWVSVLFVCVALLVQVLPR